MIHDSTMLWGYDLDKIIPSLQVLNNILKEGYFARLVEWEPIEIDLEEYNEIVQILTTISMSKPYRVG